MLKRIKNKLLNINALVKADKGNTTEQYNMKVDEFIKVIIFPKFQLILQVSLSNLLIMLLTISQVCLMRLSVACLSL